MYIVYDKTFGILSKSNWKNLDDALHYTMQHIFASLTENEAKNLWSCTSEIYNTLKGLNKFTLKNNSWWIENVGEEGPKEFIVTIEWNHMTTVKVKANTKEEAVDIIRDRAEMGDKDIWGEAKESFYKNTEISSVY